MQTKNLTHCTTPPRPLRSVALLCILLLASTAKAAFDVPIHSVEADFAGLNIRYYVRATPIRITLNVINHDSKEVICDAQYRSGPQTYDTTEINIAAGEADSFVFRYGRKTEKVKLLLHCIPAKSLDEAQADALTEAEAEAEAEAENTEGTP